MQKIQKEGTIDTTEKFKKTLIASVSKKARLTNRGFTDNSF